MYLRRIRNLTLMLLVCIMCCGIQVCAEEPIVSIDAKYRWTYAAVDEVLSKEWITVTAECADGSTYELSESEYYLEYNTSTEGTVPVTVKLNSNDSITDSFDIKVTPIIRPSGVGVEFCADDNYHLYYVYPKHKTFDLNHVITEDDLEFDFCYRGGFIQASDGSLTAPLLSSSHETCPDDNFPAGNIVLDAPTNQVGTFQGRYTTPANDFILVFDYTVVDPNASTLDSIDAVYTGELELGKTNLTTDQIDLLEVTAHYSDGSQTVLSDSDYTIDSVDAPNLIDKGTIQVSFDGKTDSCEAVVYTDMSAKQDGSIKGYIKNTSEIYVIGSGDMYNYNKSPFYDYAGSINDLTVVGDITTIGSSAFKGLNTIENYISLPDSITNIGANAFEYINYHKPFVMPDSVISIGELAFAKSNFTDTFSFNTALETIGASAFKQSYTGATVTIPASVKDIDDNAFYNCYDLNSLVFEDSNNRLSIGASCFEQCYNLECDILINRDIFAGARAFADTAITSFVINATTPSTLSTECFDNCVKLETFETNAVIFDDATALNDCPISYMDLGLTNPNQYPNVVVGSPTHKMKLFVDTSYENDARGFNWVNNNAYVNWWHLYELQADYVGSTVFLDFCDKDDFDITVVYQKLDVNNYDSPEVEEVIADDFTKSTIDFTYNAVDKTAVFVKEEEDFVTEPTTGLKIRVGDLSTVQLDYAFLDATVIYNGELRLDMAPDEFTDFDNLEVKVEGEIIPSSEYKVIDIWTNLKDGGTITVEMTDRWSTNPKNPTIKLWSNFVPVYADMSVEGDESVKGYLKDGTSAYIIGQGAIKDYERVDASNGTYMITSPYFNYRDVVKSIEIQDGITRVGNCTFQVTTSISSPLEFPDSVKEIGEYAFSYCKFEDTVKTDGVTLENQCFYNSTFNGEVTVLDCGVIGKSALGYSKFKEPVHVEGTTLKYRGLGVSTFDKGLILDIDTLCTESLMNSVVYGDIDVTEVRVLEEGALWLLKVYDDALEFFAIEEIGEEALCGCDIKGLTINNPDGTNFDTQSLSHVQCRGDATLINMKETKDLFSYSNVYGNVTLGVHPDNNGLLAVGSLTNYGNEAVKGDFIFDETITEVQSTGCPFYSGYVCGDVIFKKVEKVGDQFCMRLNHGGDVIFSDDLKYLGEQAFHYSSHFKSNCCDVCARERTGTIDFGNNLEYIGVECFLYAMLDNCTLTVPSSVKNIDDRAFAYTMFYGVDATVEEGIERIGDRAFNCAQMKSLDLTLGGDDNCVIEDYAMLYNRIQTLEVTMKEGLVKIGDYALAYNSSNWVTPVTLPASLKYIGNSGLRYATSLKGISLAPNSQLEYIGDYAFEAASQHEGEMYLPDGLEYIGNGAFQGNSQMKADIEFPDSLQYIGDWAFNSCGQMTGHLVVGSNLEYIGDGAFTQCSNLNSINAVDGNDLSKELVIGSLAFRNCNLTGTLNTKRPITYKGGLSANQITEVGLNGSKADFQGDFDSNRISKVEVLADDVIYTSVPPFINNPVTYMNLGTSKPYDHENEPVNAYSLFQVGAPVHKMQLYTEDVNNAIQYNWINNNAYVNWTDVTGIRAVYKGQPVIEGTMPDKSDYDLYLTYTKYDINDYATGVETESLVYDVNVLNEITMDCSNFVLGQENPVTFKYKELEYTTDITQPDIKIPLEDEYEVSTINTDAPVVEKKIVSRKTLIALSATYVGDPVPLDVDVNKSDISVVATYDVVYDNGTEGRADIRLGEDEFDIISGLTCTIIGNNPLTVQHSTLTTNCTYPGICIHPITHDVIEDPKCTVDGKVSTHCSNPDCNALIKEVVIPALGHEHKLIEDIKPTCTTAGKQVFECIRKDDTYEIPIPELGHDVSSNKIKDPTCIEDGKILDDCSRCDLSGETILPKLGHDMHEEIILKPTCTTPGIKRFTCVRNDLTYEEEIPALGHIKGDMIVVKEPTCVLSGMKEARCTRETCNALLDYELLTPLGHEYESTYHEPTFEQRGYTDYVCIRKDDSYRVYDAPAKAKVHGHIVSKDGTPYQDKLVVLYADKMQYTFTDASGGFEFEEVTVGTHKFRAFKQTKEDIGDSWNGNTSTLTNLCSSTFSVGHNSTLTDPVTEEIHKDVKPTYTVEEDDLDIELNVNKGDKTSTPPKEDPKPPVDVVPPIVPNPPVQKEEIPKLVWYPVTLPNPQQVLPPLLPQTGTDVFGGEQFVY